jgi:hypothetical protein
LADAFEGSKQQKLENLKEKGVRMDGVGWINLAEDMDSWRDGFP